MRTRRKPTSLNLEPSAINPFPSQYLRYSAENNPQYKNELDAAAREPALKEFATSLSAVVLRGISTIKNHRGIEVFDHADFDDLTNLLYNKKDEKINDKGTRTCTLKLKKELKKGRGINYGYLRKIFESIKQDFVSLKSMEEVQERINQMQNVSLASNTKNSCKKAIAGFLQRFLDHNGDCNTPFPFKKYALECELDLIFNQLFTIRPPGEDVQNFVENPQPTKDQKRDGLKEIDISRSHRGLSRGRENPLPIQMSLIYRCHLEAEQAYKLGSKFPEESAKKQYKALATGGKLNIALRNPATRPFRSILKIRLETSVLPLSDAQTEALEAIENAIDFTKKRKDGEAAGHVKLRLETGGGKSHLLKIVETYYQSKFELTTKNFTLNNFLNSKDELLATPSLENQLIMLDEEFFYNDRFFVGENLEKKEEEVNNYIAKLRQKGAIVIIVGASESLEKVKIEIARLDHKVEKRRNDYDNLRREITRLEEGSNSLKSIYSFLNDFAKDRYYQRKTTSKHWGGADGERNSKRFKTQLIRIRQINNQYDKSIFPPDLLEICIKLTEHKFSALAYKTMMSLLGKKVNQIGKDFTAPDEDIITKKEFKLIKRLVNSSAIEYEKGSNPITTAERLIDMKEEIVNEVRKEIRNFGNVITKTETKLIERRKYLEDLTIRRDVKPFDRIEASEYVKDGSKHVGTLDNLVEDNLYALEDGNKLQYILPDYDIQEESATQAIAQKIIDKSSANLVIIPILKADGQLQYNVFTKKDNEIKLHELTDENLKERINFLQTYLENKTRMVCFFDKKNAIGGDYASASVGITHQIIHVDKSKNLTSNLLMQCNRDRTVDEDRREDETVTRKFIISEDIEKAALIAKVRENSSEDDKTRAKAYLNSKISRESDKIKKERYEKFKAGDFDIPQIEEEELEDDEIGMDDEGYILRQKASKMGFKLPERQVISAVKTVNKGGSTTRRTQVRKSRRPTDQASSFEPPKPPNTQQRTRATAKATTLKPRTSPLNPNAVLKERKQSQVLKRAQKRAEKNAQKEAKLGTPIMRTSTSLADLMSTAQSKARTAASPSQANHTPRVHFPFPVPKPSMKASKSTPVIPHLDLSVLSGEALPPEHSANSPVFDDGDGYDIDGYDSDGYDGDGYDGDGYDGDGHDGDGYDSDGYDSDGYDGDGYDGDGHDGDGYDSDGYDSDGYDGDGYDGDGYDSEYGADFDEVFDIEHELMDPDLTGVNPDNPEHKEALPPGYSTPPTSESYYTTDDDTESYVGDDDNPLSSPINTHKVDYAPIAEQIAELVFAKNKDKPTGSVTLFNAFAKIVKRFTEIKVEKDLKNEEITPEDLWKDQKVSNAQKTALISYLVSPDKIQGDELRNIRLFNKKTKQNYEYFNGGTFDPNNNNYSSLEEFNKINDTLGKFDDAFYRLYNNYQDIEQVQKISEAIKERRNPDKPSSIITPNESSKLDRILNSAYKN